MKKHVFNAIIIFSVIMLPLLSHAQMRGPENPGGGPTGSDPPLGGGAPIGGGLFILIGLGAVYGGRKIYQLYQDGVEKLEE